MAETDKVTRMLALYSRLIRGKKVNKANFCQEYGIQSRSFDRDIEDIRLFLSESYTFDELTYSRRDNSYQLSHVTTAELSGEEVVVLGTALLSQKTFRRDELDELMKNLIDITEFQNRQAIYRIMKEKLENCGHEKTAFASLKIQWDIERCILARKVIVLNYQKGNGDYVKRKVMPLEIIYDDGYAYLMAYRSDEDYIYPAFYRLDRIYSFTVENEIFQEKEVEKYRKLNIHNYLKYMQAGELLAIKIKCNRSKKRLVQESFRETVIIEESETDCLFLIKSFKKGFLQWLLRQGDSVEVLEPIELREEILRIAEALHKIYTKGEL